MFDAAGATTATAVAADMHAPVEAGTKPADEQDHSSTAGNGASDPVTDVGPFGSKAEAQFIQAESQSQAPRHEIVFVDARLPELGSLTPAPGVELVVLDPERDGLAQVSAALAGRSGLDAVHFVGHGEGGAFTLGRTVVDAALVEARGAEIASWSAALNGDADIMIWGCDVAGTPAGQALLGSLAMLTGGDVAASDDRTGAQERGGDWVLEARTGAIETALPFEAEALAAWNHDLAPPTISGERNLQVAEPSTLNPAFGTSASVNLDEAGWGLGYDAADATDAVTVSVTVADTSIGALTDTVGGGVRLDNVWTFNGTMQQADAWLKGLTFTAADVERGNAIASTEIAVSVTNQTDGGTADRTAAIRVTASNDPTVLGDVTVSVPEVGPGGAASVTILDGTMIAPTDAEVAFGTQDTSQIVYTLETDTLYGHLTLNDVRIGQGSVFTQADIEAGRLAYVHTATGAQQNAQDAFVVRVNDGATPLAHSERATIRLDIAPVNQAPNVSGGGHVYEGQPNNAQGPGAAPSKVGDYIVADGGGDPNDPLLIVRLDSLPTDGTLHFSGTVTIGGVVQTINRAITAADIAAGISFAYADRGQLTYAHNGVDQANGRPNPQDGFNVTVIDGGGGAGAAAAETASSRIKLDVLPVNDEPVWAGGSLEATVDASHSVTLDTSMLNVSDPDSLDDSLSFVVTEREMDKGRLYLTPVGGGTPVPLPVGATFTLADVKAGRVHYVQHLGAGPNETDSFRFQVVDNGVSLHWRDDGTLYERPSGIYDDPASETSRLKDFTFTIRLHETSGGAGGALPDDPDRTPSHQSSEHAGTDANGHAVGDLTEGGTIVLFDGQPSGGLERPGLHYTVPGVAPEQIVYTVMSFDGVASGWNGVLQKQVGSDWVTLSQYDSFTQADLNAGRVRFVHDGGEDFESSVKLRASAGILIDDGAGGLAMDEWITDFHFYATPENDAPVATGSTENIIKEGQTVAITGDMLSFADPDDATSEARHEAGSDNALNHDAANPLVFFIDRQPANGHLEWFDGASWLRVELTTELQASWLTSDPATTRLRYVHAGGEDRLDDFSVHAQDRWGDVSKSATVTFVITPVNDAPDIAANPTSPDPTGPWPGGGGSGAVNNPMTVIYEGSWQKITPDLLQAVDPDSSATQVQYSVTQAPAHGRLAYSKDGINFTTLGKGSSFTQDDIAKGYIYYQHGGDEPSGTGYPGTPDDKFVFTLSDGAAEVTGREFWIYVQPTNDAPVVKAPSGPIDSTDTVTAIPGFSVSDPDLADGVNAAEANFLQVAVRLLDENGNALPLAGYAGATLGVTAGGATVDATQNGVGGILVLRGTQAQINAALATLSVSFGDDRDAVYRVQVIADDRVRDAGGALVDRDPAAPGSNPGGNGGGTHNQPDKPYTGSPQPVSGYDGFNWYQDAVPHASNSNPAIAALVGNIAAAEVTIRASRVNDPAVLTGTGTATVYEDQATPIGSQIRFQISDAESAAFGTPVTVTLSVPYGTLSLGTMPPGLNVEVSGNNSGTMRLTGTAADIEAYLNAALRYQSATDSNHDRNGGAPGDVTLTVTFDDTGSNIGSGGAHANPAPLEIGLTIVPVNDRPTVSAGSGTLVVSGTTPVDGFSVADKDIDSDGFSVPAAGETDFVQVTVRLTDASGVPLSLAGHGDVIFSSAASPSEGANFEIDDTENGNGRALVIRGTRAEVNAYLAGLTVTLQGTLANRDGGLRIEVVADDRVRDVKTGALTGTEANGGGNNNPAGGVSAVPTTAVDPYAVVPGGLTENVNQANRVIFPSSVNDPAEIRVTPPTPAEGSATVQLSGVTISDPDAMPGDILTATVTVPPGFVISAITAGGSTVGGVGTETVTISGTLAQINSAVNSIRIQLPDEAGTPDRADWNGTFNVTITVDDRGNNGGRPTSLPGDTDNPSADPGDFAYADPDGNDGDPDNDNHLVTTRSFSITVAPVNDAPVVVPVGGSTAVTLAGTEDATGAAIPTHTVSSLFQGYFDDSRDAISGGSASDSFAGVVVVGLTTNPAQGSWQYFNGTSWVDIGPHTLASGLYLAADAQIRFAPAADFHGTPENLTVRLAEHPASAPTTGTVVDLSAANATGGTTRYSAGSIVVTTSVANVNDAPTLTGATLASVNEDTLSPPGETVANLFGSLYSDATDDRRAVAGGGNAATPFGGIAITGNAANSAQGEWQYSLNGTDWTTVRSDLSDGDALLLAPTARLRFVLAADFNGTPGGLTVRASDAPVSFAASADLSGDLGPTGAWSNAVALGTTVIPLNDAPLLSGTATNPMVTENGQTGTGTSLPPTVLFVPGTITLSDIDLTTTPGLGAGVFGAGEIELSLGSSYLAGDRLALAAGFTLPAGVTIDAVHDGSAGRLVIKLAPGTSVADVLALIENVTYSSSSDNPTDFGTKTTRSYTLVVRDGNNRDGQNDTAGGPASLASAPLSGTITIAATNDPPIAEDNLNTIAEDTASVSGNVILDPSPGGAVDHDPDTPVGDLRISGITFGATPGTVGSGLSGAYGTLTLNADGSYSYALDNSNPVVNALRDGQTLTEVFSYTLSDGSATDTATLTITIAGRTDGAPTIVPADLNGAVNGENSVSERGLGDAGDASETTTGTVTVTAPDGLSTVTVGGQVITLAELQALGTTPITVTTPKGVLTITGFTPGATVGGVPVSGALSYSYTLTAAQDHSGGDVSDIIALAIGDAGGGTATGTLTIAIADDVPQARDDVATIEEDVASVAGNVITTGAGADRVGADGATVTEVGFGGTAGTVGSPVLGAYGTLTLNADGSYSYALDNGNPVVNALRDGETLTEVFSYRIVDGDGDESTATLTITITGRTDGVAAIVPTDMNGAAHGENSVSERGLGDAADASETTTGTVTVTAPDGLSTVTVGGRVITLAELQALGTTPITVTTPKGVLTITGFTPGATVGSVPVSGELSYSYTLTAVQDHSGGDVSDVIALAVGDAGGGTGTGTLTIAIADAVPQARDDAATIAEDGSSDTVGGNVFTGAGTGDVADSAGNDGPAAGGPVTGVGFGATAGTVGSGLSGAYGTLTLNADGSYGYVLDNGNAAVNGLSDGQTLTEVFTYRISDADGSTSYATLTITITGRTDGAPGIVPTDMNGAANGENSVSERGLGDAGDASETTTGTVTVTAPDGLSTVTVGGRVITLAELQALGTTPVTVTTPKGVLTITGFTPGATVGGVPVSGELSYSYTLTAAQDHSGGDVSDVIALVVGDAGGGTATGTLTIAIADDVPQARDDAATVTEGDPSVSGNVITTGAGADRVGADGATVTEVGFGATAGTVGSALSGAYGTLTLNPDGSYSYALDNGNSAVSGLSDGETLTEVFTYRIVDADGDESTATLTITIAGHNEPLAPVLPDQGVGMLPGRPPGAAFVELGANSYLEGRPYDRYLTFGQVVSQQVLFRIGGTSTGGSLHYDASLGVDQPLPSWISFDPSLQLVTARPTRDVAPGLYLVRVTARDGNGNYAESSVSFRILRDIDEVVRWLSKAVPSITLPVSVPAGDEPPHPHPPERQAPEEGAPPEPAPDKQARSPAQTPIEVVSIGDAALPGEEQRPSRSLTQSLINAGFVGQMIEAARLLEALTPETPSKS